MFDSILHVLKLNDTTLRSLFAWPARLLLYEFDVCNFVKFWPVLYKCGLSSKRV